MPTATPTTRQWVDAFFGSMEIVADLLADRQKIQAQFNTTIHGKTFDLEAYRERRDVWRRVKTKILSLGLDVESLEFEGATKNASGDWIVVDPKGLAVYHEGDQTAMIFNGDEAQCMMNFLAFFLASAQQGIDPKSYVRGVLGEQGIDRTNFHLYRDKLAISNPWE